MGLHRRLAAAGAGTASLLAHPGLSNTDLQTHSVTETGGGASQRFFETMAARTGMRPDQGALPQLRAATDPQARSGEFYAPRFVNSGAPVRRPILRRLGLARSIDVLWEVSERETGVVLDVAAAVARRHVTSAPPDKAAAVRSALRRLVAERGLHGASMAAVAADAGVATGTAYVHYPSKDDLLVAAYVELKIDLGRAAVVGLDPGTAAEDRFRSMWHAVHDFLAAEPDRARFLVQVEASPHAVAAHTAALADGDDPFLVAATAPDLAARLRPLPLEVLWDLGFGPAIRLVASGQTLDSAALATLADACWHAITRD